MNTNYINRQILILTESLREILNAHFQQVAALSAKIDGLLQEPIKESKPVSIKLPEFLPETPSLKDKQFLSLKDLGAIYGLKRTTVYRQIGEFLFTAPVKLGSNKVAWPRSEVMAIMDARTRGLSNKELKKFVMQLQENRSKKS